MPIAYHIFFCERRNVLDYHFFSADNAYFVVTTDGVGRFIEIVMANNADIGVALLY